MKLAECLIAWNSESDQIKVGYLLKQGDADWTKPYRKTGGGAYTKVREMSGLEARHYVMSEFLGIVIRDRVDLDAAHREFLNIEEYRLAIPTDLAGADDGRDYLD